MRLLGIDYGLRRTGLALGDTESRLALPFEVFEGLPNPQLAQAIGQVVRREGIDAIVIGLPLNADGSVSGQSRLTERFIVTLQQVVGAGGGPGGAGGREGGGGGPPIHRTSEYLTTHDVEGRLAGHYTRLQKRARVDALAAARILQDWLDAHPLET